VFSVVRMRWSRLCPGVGVQNIVWIRVNNVVFVQSFLSRQELARATNWATVGLIDLIRLLPQASKISTYRLFLDWFRQKSE
jgi:hypothetical protein